MRYFISGHIDITYEDFLSHYSEQIDDALKDPDCSFLIGDSNGTDKFAQSYLFNKVDKSKVIIFHTGKYPKNNIHNFNTSANHISHTQKDKAMTLNSDADILWIRSKEETKKMYGEKYKENRISGTEQNLIRRQQLLNKFVA